MLINYPRCAPRANYTCHLSIPQYISNRDRGFDWFREGSKRTPTVRVRSDTSEPSRSRRRRT